MTSRERRNSSTRMTDTAMVALDSCLRPEAPMCTWDVGSTVLVDTIAGYTLVGTTRNVRMSQYVNWEVCLLVLVS